MLDGKPGLPGFNGGNLIIISNNIVNLEFLNYSSFGGKGGNGQNGNFLNGLYSLNIVIK